MKKRIRKKHHVGEFAVFGFELHLHFDTEEDQILDETGLKIVELVQNRQWECYGALEQLFVFEGKPGQKIAENKDAFVAELKSLPHVTEVHAHEVIDAWNGPAIDLGGCSCECCGK